MPISNRKDEQPMKFQQRPEPNPMKEQQKPGITVSPNQTPEQAKRFLTFLLMMGMQFDEELKRQGLPGMLPPPFGENEEVGQRE